MQIAGYTVLETLLDTPEVRLYRAHDPAAERDVILKLPPSANSTPEAIRPLQQEFDLTHDQPLPGLLRSLELLPFEDSWLLVEEDFKGKPLSTLQAAYHAEPARVIQLALAIAEALKGLHEHKLVHQRLMPANILVDPHTQAVRLVGWHAAVNPATLGQELPDEYLPYTAPEQTGRINRRVDYRSDYYALGALLHELVTGHPPFAGEDALQLIHAHLTTPPPAATQQDATIPEALSQLIQKLLAKEPDQRYQSLHGLAHDLRLCQSLNDLHQTLELGQKDIPDRLHFQQTLYGRDDELNRLRQLIDAAAEGRGESVFVSGYAGVGKSSLIAALEPYVLERGGYLLSGKFEPTARDVPYASIIQAFRALVNRLLSEGSEVLETHKAQLAKALGHNAYLITSVIPEVELLVGQHAPPLDLSPQENDNRFQLTFRNFLRVFTKPGQPLILHLDDLQWADYASLQLIRRIVLEWNLPSLLLIGTYRDSDVTASHPLAKLFDELKAQGQVNKQLLLQPLLSEHLRQLIADALHTPPEQVSDLSQLVYEKTKGNPYFAIAFLKSLHDDGLLKFDPESFAWQWSLNEIRARAVTGNVVDLILRNMQRLPQDTRQAIELASLIGQRFDLGTLAQLSDKEPRQLQSDLEPALEAELIFESSTHLRPAPGSVPITSLAGLSFVFSHDRVLQTAYDQLTPARRATLSLKLARLLIAQGPDNIENSDRLFPILEHLQLAEALVQESPDKEEIARLYLAGGRRARLSAAYTQAAEYLAAGRQLLPPDAWQRLPRLTAELQIESAEVAYLMDDFAQMEASAAEIEREATDLMDRVRIYGILLPAYNGRYDIDKSLQVTRHALKLLGVRIPSKPHWWLLLYHIAKIKWNMRRATPESIVALPTCHDPLKVAAIRILVHATFAAYFHSPNMVPILTSICIQIMLKHGHSPYSAVIVSGYSLILSGILGEINRGHAFAKIALAMPEQHNSREFHAKIYLAHSAIVTHWKEPLRNTIPQILTGFHSALENGDLEYAGLFAHMYCYNSLFAGVRLPELEARILEYNDVIRSLNHPRHLINNQLLLQVVHNLTGRNESSNWQLDGELLHGEETVKQLTQSDDNTTLLDFHYFTAYLAYLFDQDEAAVHALKRSRPHLGGAMGTAVVPPYTLLRGLIQLRQAEQSTGLRRWVLLTRVDWDCRKLANWTQYAPHNQQHRLALLKAETSRVRGQAAEAMRAYSEAITLAKQNGYLYDLALANELTGRFYHALGQEEFARRYLTDAYHDYASWGATAKTDSLIKRYPDLVQPSHPGSAASQPTTQQYIQHTGNYVLDMNSAVKAAQTLSSEFDLDQLYQKMLSIIMENAGAERAILLTGEGDRLLLRAQGEAGGERIHRLPDTPLLETDSLSIGIVQYVARTQKTVLLQNASQDEMFRTDDYILLHQPKSILCLPIRHQGQLLGILYLENNLTDAAFTNERLQLLPILVSQAAISIDHALDRQRIAADRDRIETIVNSVADALLAINAAGEVTLINPTAHSWLGEDTTPLGAPVGQLFRLEDPLSGQSLLGGNEQPSLLSSNHAVLIERARFVPAAGATRDVTLSVSPMLTDTGERGAVVLLHDRSAEQQLEDAKDDFISTASHELRTPLTVLRWGLEAFNYDQELSDPQKAKAQIETLGTRVERMQDIVEALLAASKLQAMPPAIGGCMLELEDLIHQSATQCQETFMAKGIDLQLPPISPTHAVLAEPKLLIPLIEELVKNACRFTEQGKVEITVYQGSTLGDVRFQDKRLSLHDKIVLEVRDSGCGIAPDHQDQVFRSFFQEGGSLGRQEAKGGLGIGLYLARLRAEKLGGELWFESVKDRGSSFYLALPSAYSAKS